MKKAFQIISFTILCCAFGYCFENPIPIASKFDPTTDMIFYLRVGQNRSFSDYKTITFETKESIKNYHYDPKKPTIFQVHGYWENINNEPHVKLSETILETHDVNLFSVDWGKGSHTMIFYLAASRVPGVSVVIGDFMVYLHEQYGVDYKSFTCIGFSLGGAICGYVSQQLHDRRIGKLVGLDSGIVKEPLERELVADYVEAIITSVPLAIHSLNSHANFFFNKGSTPQPGCPDQLCSHYRAIWYYIELLKNPEAFFGKSCKDFDQVMSGTCDGAQNGEFAGKDENLDRKIMGIFNVETNAESPFGRGKEE